MTNLSQTGVDAYAQMLQIFELLKQTSSIGVISGYLKSKGLVHSASSWEDLLTKRIEPAFSENKISLAELLTLLRNAEESGRQHVFLYSCSVATARALSDKASVIPKLAAKGLSHVATAPLLLAEAPTAQIVDVRWDDSRFTVKIVAQRRVNELESTETDAEGFTTKIYKLVNKRVVHVFRLHLDGTLELRVASHASSTRYTEEITSLLAMVDFLMPIGDFRPISLKKAKNFLWTERQTLVDKVRFIDSIMKNDEGFMVRGISSSDGGNITESPSTVHSLESFRDDNGYCETQNIYFIPYGEPAFPPKEVHVILAGAINEYAIPAQCSHLDYEYVFNEIKKFNA